MNIAILFFEGFFIKAIILAPLVFATIEFLGVLINHKRFLNQLFSNIFDLGILIIYPFLFLWMDNLNENICCSGFSVLAPEYQGALYSLTAICTVTYFVSKNRDTLASPIIEVLINVLLLIAVLINAVLIWQIQQLAFFFINLAIGLLFVTALLENQYRLSMHAFDGDYALDSPVKQFAWWLITISPIAKYPVLLLLCLPVLILFSLFLMLCGQKPNALILAFTQTYGYQLSELQKSCEDAVCGGGHYLCSVAANGHATVVQPERIGYRRNKRIICNRQLLIANAFEELIEQKCPKVHSIIRKNYNRVGFLVHKYYYLFSNKYLSDFIYILMKPLEWFFLFTLYLLDVNPESRIAQQYLAISDRKKLSAPSNIRYQ